MSVKPLNPTRPAPAQRPTAAKPQTAIAQTAARVSRIDSSAVQKNQQTSQGYFNRAIKMMKAVASHPVTKAALLTVASNSILNAAGFMPAWTRPLTVQGIYGLATSGISSLINTIGGSSTLDPNGTTPFETLYEVLSQKCEAPRIIKAAREVVVREVDIIEAVKLGGAIAGAIVAGVSVIVGTLVYCTIRGEKAAYHEPDQDEDLEAQPIQYQGEPTFLSKAFTTVKDIVTHPITKKVALFALAANSILHAADVMPACTRFLTVQEISKVAASSINSFIQRAFFEPLRPDDFVFANPMMLTMIYTPLAIWETTFGISYCFAQNEKIRNGARENLLLFRAAYAFTTTILATATACEYYFGKGPGA